MKSLILALVAITCLSAIAAEETVTVSKMANLLSSRETASCLDQLQSLGRSYQVSGIAVAKDDAKNEVRTSISYRLFNTDMVTGSAEIVVIEKGYTPWGAPPGHLVLGVVGCEYSHKLY